jgi:hypothetical protein
VYLADGSLVSLVEGQPGAERMLVHAHEVLTTARS